MDSTIWLYYELSADGEVTDGRAGSAALPIRNHLAQIPQGRFANELLRQVVYHRTDVIGRLLPPAYAWRLATEAEVQAHQTAAAVLTEVVPVGGKALKG